jgi:hypothetical protein
MKELKIHKVSIYLNELNDIWLYASYWRQNEKKVLQHLKKGADTTNGIVKSIGVSYRTGEKCCFALFNKGLLALIRTPTQTHINGVWGLSPDFVKAGKELRT